MKRVGALIRVGVALAAVLATTPAQASTHWQDTTLSTLQDGAWPAAVFDPVTGCFLTLVVGGYSLELRSYKPDHRRPMWTVNFADAGRLVTEGARPLLVSPEDHRVYVGGGYLDGQTDNGTSAGFVYAFDTRTGKTVWSHTDITRPGMGGLYDRLTRGTDGSVIAFESILRSGAMNSSDSYSIAATAFGPAGGQRWRWTDDRRGPLAAATTTSTGLVALAAETYNSSGWARAYFLGLDAATGSLRWRHVLADHAEGFTSVTSAADGRAVYITGYATNDAAGHHGGSRATLHALSPKTGKIRWTKYVGALGSDKSYDMSNLVIATPSGPCITGSHEGSQPVTYTPILPDNGFVACYKSTGSLRWRDLDTQAGGRALVVDHRHLLFVGRQETARANYSREVVRFQIRSLADGAVLHSSSRSSTCYVYSPSGPLAVTRVGNAVHFLTSIGPVPDQATGSEKVPYRLLDRSYR